MSLSRGAEGWAWLQSQGFEAKVPHLRSTMAKRALTDPFSFYLIDRLGICPSLAYSAALNRGSWFHEACRLIGGQPFDENHPELNLLLEARLVELNAACARHGITGELKNEILENERRDSLTTRAWIAAYHEVPIHIGGRPSTFAEYISRSYWCTPVLESTGEPCTEVLMSLLGPPEFPEATLSIQADRLLYHRGDNSLWLPDYKTTAAPCLSRLSTCPREFQTLHYLFVLRNMLASGYLSERLLVDGVRLPPDCKLGGMIHIAFRKPAIQFGMNDRNHVLDTTPLKSGPRKGQPRNERTYDGEPVFANYLGRVKDWCLGRGLYSDKAGELSTAPNVNMSFTYGSALDADSEAEYLQMLHRAHSLATAVPHPSNFYRTLEGAVGLGGDLTDMSPFHLQPLEDWPSIMTRGRYFFNHRNESALTGTDTMGIKVL